MKNSTINEKYVLNLLKIHNVRCDNVKSVGKYWLFKYDQNNIIDIPNDIDILNNLTSFGKKIFNVLDINERHFKIKLN